MSYCPEHGAEMAIRTRDLVGYVNGSATYDCPEGETWLYNADEGTYRCVGDSLEVTQPCATPSRSRT
ncbi:hypothetical protein LCGC14_2966670 [marine sediment metagenome]|uniref:Uncharacterized protein n=1 Tax=marine sediment metagenome TaxID=412755 RepID=A0A0F9A1X0_9ZZZZ